MDTFMNHERSRPPLLISKSTLLKRGTATSSLSVLRSLIITKHFTSTPKQRRKLLFVPSSEAYEVFHKVHPSKVQNCFQTDFPSDILSFCFTHSHFYSFSLFSLSYFSLIPSLSFYLLLFLSNSHSSLSLSLTLLEHQLPITLHWRMLYLNVTWNFPSKLSSQKRVTLENRFSLSRDLPELL